MRAPEPEWEGDTQADYTGRPMRCYESGAIVIKVRPRGSESIQQMLKRFKRLCQREGLTRDMKRTSYYEKPSERRRRKVRKAQRRVVAA